MIRLLRYARKLDAPFHCLSMLTHQLHAPVPAASWARLQPLHGGRHASCNGSGIRHQQRQMTRHLVHNLVSANSTCSARTAWQAVHSSSSSNGSSNGSGSSRRRRIGDTSISAAQAACGRRHCVVAAAAAAARGCQPVVAAAADATEEPTCVRVTIPRVSGDVAEVLSDFLLGFEAQSVTVEEAARGPGQAEQQIFGASEELWDNCCVTAYFDLEHDVDATLHLAEDTLEVSLDWSLSPVVNRDWVDQIKASYTPQQVCPGLWIIPTWSEVTDPAAVNIILEPGVAFGTGEHPTTAMCLRQLMAWGSAGLGGARVMDYGAGSGVLALTALKLGAAAAVGTDTDPLAVKAAARNAEHNSCSAGFVSLRCSPHLADPEPVQEAGLPAVTAFDLVMANILRGPLLELAPRLGAYCRPGGRLLLSGILQEQVPEVQEAYSSTFSDWQMTSSGSWAMLTAVRKG